MIKRGINLTRKIYPRVYVFLLYSLKARIQCYNADKLKKKKSMIKIEKAENKLASLLQIAEQQFIGILETNDIFIYFIVSFQFFLFFYLHIMIHHLVQHRKNTCDKRRRKKEKEWGKKRWRKKERKEEQRSKR